MTGEWILPASYAQERIWFASQLVGAEPVYQLIDQVALPYALSYPRLRDALIQVAGRHDSLRTSLRVCDGALCQVVHTEVPYDIAEVAGDLGAEPIADLAAELTRSPFDLGRAPLWRARLAPTSGGWLLLFVAHHVVVDATSLRNLRAELSEICTAAVADRAARLPDLPIQYADYTAWQRERLTGAEHDRLMAFWRDALDGLPLVHGLRTDLPRPARRGFAGAEVRLGVGEAIRAGVAELARAAGATPFMVNFAAYVAVLHALSGCDDIVVAVPVAGRDLPELRYLMGMFVNMVVIRVDTRADPTFTELLTRTKDAALAAFDHQEMPFQLLVQALASRREPGVAPLYQLAFNFAISPRIDSAEDELNLEVYQDRLRLEYNTTLFEPESARQIAQAYLDVLATAVAEPETALSHLDSAARATATRLCAPAPAAAPSPAVTVPDGAAWLAPSGPAQELVARVWSQVLGAQRIGVRDDFFDLGGHSLLALRVIARIATVTGVELPVESFFADTTLAGVAGELQRRLAAEVALLSDDHVRALLAGGGGG